jgi:rSAM/selenodomain-associated transferase 2
MSSSLPPLDVVIAVRDEAERLPSLLADLAAGAALLREVIVVDGESRDGTAAVAALAGARVLRSTAGRGRQLAAGVGSGSGDWLLLLHGDVRLPAGWPAVVARAMAATDAGAWAFQLRIDGHDPCLRLVEWAVALRSRWRQLPYGDQGLLLSRGLYEASGGIAPLPLMEDLEFVQRLRRRARIVSLGLPLRVDGRRWRRLGVWQTVWANARLRRDWRRGVAVERLRQRYYGEASVG